MQTQSHLSVHDISTGSQDIQIEMVKSTFNSKHKDKPVLLICYIVQMNYPFLKEIVFVESASTAVLLKELLNELIK